VHREFFRDHPEKFDLRDPGKIYIEEYAKMMAHKNQALGSAGQLDDVRAKLGKK
jgi:fructose-bisphosphate aldolase class II